MGQLMQDTLSCPINLNSDEAQSFIDLRHSMNTILELHGYTTRSQADLILR
jgi:hypothetical protein